MPYELFLALKYLRAHPHRRLARVTALAALAGIAFGVAALIVALALSNGFRDEMRDKILRGTAHITVARRDVQPIRDYQAIIARLKRIEGVKDAAATSYDGALLTGASTSAYAVLRGVDGESTGSIENVRRTLIEGSIKPLLKDAELAKERETVTPDDSKSERRNEGVRVADGPRLEAFSKPPSDDVALPQVIIGAELAERTGLRVGDVAQIISGEGTLTPLGLAPRYRRVRVAGIFRSGLYEYDATWVYASLATVSSFAGETQPVASIISLEVADIYAADQVAARVRQDLGGSFTTIDWQEANRPLFAALALERRMGLFIIALIILIAALNITTTLVLIVVERRYDIAILSAMGARPFSIMLLFMIEGALLGMMGALLGVMLGVVASVIGNRYKLVSLPADVYSLSNIPFHTEWRDILLAALIAFLLSLLATVYPARAAARMRPAEALRAQ